MFRLQVFHLDVAQRLSTTGQSSGAALPKSVLAFLLKKWRSVANVLHLINETIEQHVEMHEIGVDALCLATCIAFRFRSHSFL